MNNLVTPPIPEIPAIDAGWHAWDIYLRAVRENNQVVEIEVRKQQADASSAVAASYQAMADAMNQPIAKTKLSRGDLAAQLLPNWPHTRRQTETSAVEEIKATIDAFALKYPGTLAD